MNSYLLLDGNNLSHIAFHKAKAIVIKKYKTENPEYLLRENEYSEVSGMMLLVFFRKLHKLFKIFKNHYFVFTWDNAGSSKWRKEIFPDYKSHRVYEDNVWRVLFENIDKIKIILESYPIYQLGMSGLEADDIIYALARDLYKQNKVIIITSDSDMIQIVQEFKKNIKIFNPIKDKYAEIPDFDIVLYKSFLGEKGEDIPGIPGCGEKTSIKFAKEIMSGEKTIAECLKNDSEKIDIINRNLKLIRIKNNPNIPNLKYNVNDIHTSHRKIDLSKIQKFYFDSKLKSLLETFESISSLFT